MVIAAGKFKAQCLELMDRVSRTHEKITISKRGKVVARLMAAENLPEPAIIGYLAGSASVNGDITLPIEEQWHAQQ